MHVPEIGPLLFRSLPVREQLWHLEDRKCHWCRKPTVYGGKMGPDSATIDHVIPRGRGGSNKRDNLVSACSHCNDARNREDQRAHAAKKQLVSPPLTVLQQEVRRQRQSEAELRMQLREYEQMSVRAFALQKLIAWLHGIQRKMQNKVAPESTQVPSV